MLDERGAAPARGERGQWIGAIAVALLLVGVIVLGIWFGLGQPRFWQPFVSARPSPTVAQQSITATTSPLASPAPPLLTDPATQPVTTEISTFTSRELVSTALAVPFTHWANGPAQTVALSADGRWVAFTAQTFITTSTASQNSSQRSLQTERGYDDLYLVDRSQETLTHVTVAPDGSPSNGWVGAPAMVPDGRYLAFYAWATNLVAGDTNAVQDLFFYERETATISRISVGANGVQANDRSGDSGGDVPPSLSADGRFVAFHSAASNLTRGDNNGRIEPLSGLPSRTQEVRQMELRQNINVFVHDRQTMSTTLISSGPSGEAGNGDSSHPALSVDGRFVVFQSRATNLDPTVPSLQGPGVPQIYLHDRNGNSTRLISRGPDGRPGNSDSSAPAISGDGRYLVYASDASNLVAGDSNQVADIFLHDRTSGETRRVSVSSSGIQANRAAWSPQITLDGQHIAFSAEASNLVNGDGNNVADLFVHDQLARHTSRVSVAVSDAWTGQEANGPTTGYAALIPGGRLVAFVSQATNLTPTDTVCRGCGVPKLYLHERVDAPTFTLAGRVVESGGQPVADAVVGAGPHRTTTGADGNFQLSSLVGGTYTLAVAKAGYTFSPPRRTISLLRDLNAQDFLAFAGDGSYAFLDLPLAYDGSAATLLGLLRDTDEGGLIDAWFDHDAPNYTKNEGLLLWDGRRRTQDPYNDLLGCYERRCYEGHDGVDFPYRDPDPSTPNIFEPVRVRPAAAGMVVSVVRNCDNGDRRCNGGYGNEVILWHDISPNSGYFTRYSHLATVAVDDSAQANKQRLTPELTLGEMGSTGNSFGTHLHFAVHLDNGNGVWDGDQVDLPVDPFGWAGLEADPWAAHAVGPVSRWLWRFNPTTEAILLGSQGATLRDGVGNMTVRIPAGALAGQVRVELVAGAATAAPATPQRTLGRAFRLQVLDWLHGGNAPHAAPARPVEVSMSFAGAPVRHLDVEQLLLYHWQAGVGWSPLPTVVDREAQAVIAASNQFGDFDLQAPLLCPADALEPDDSFDAAIFATGATVSWDRLFDVAEDQDWFQVEAVAGMNYQVEMAATTPGVDFTVEVYDRDGLTRLNDHHILSWLRQPRQRFNLGAGTLRWTATEAGSYFVRVAPTAGSDVGCEAGYRLTISQPSSQPSGN